MNVYPKLYFDLFQPRDLIDEVFIICSFDEITKKYCDEVICPAIEDDKYGHSLKPFRVDYNLSSESITVEILYHINNARLILCEMSPIGKILIDGKEKSIRNSNVMYELGLAHARRMPQEIIVISYDLSNLPFDTSNLRIHKYNRSDSSGSIEKISKIIQEQLRNIDITRSEFVKFAINRLGPDGFLVLGQVYINKEKYFMYSSILGEDPRWNEQMRNGLKELTESGIIIFVSKEPGNRTYRWTEFGKAVLQYLDYDISFLSKS